MDPIYRLGMVPLPTGLSEGQVVLRAWDHDDLGCVEELSLDPVIPTGTTVPNPFCEEAGLAFIECQRRRWESGERLSLAITDAANGGAAGFITLLHRQQPGVAGVGYGIAASRRRQRFASTRALRMLSRWALDLAALERIEALVEPSNQGSIRVLVNAGFQREGLLRRYLAIGDGRLDVWLYSLLDSDIAPSAA